MSGSSTPLNGTSSVTTQVSSSAVVHSEYDISDPPPTPGPQWTRFVCISDTHSHLFPVPPGDVLLHAGDLTQTGTYAEFSVTMKWLKDLPHKTKIIIAGNHDVTLDHHNGWYDTHYQRWHRTKKENVAAIRKLLIGQEAIDANIIYLEDEEYQFQTKDDGRVWSVYGSPWTPYFYDWAFNYRRESQCPLVVAGIPRTDILLTHGPPANIFDKTRSGHRVGCEHLAACLPSLRPRLHVFGHIHEDHGAEIREWASSHSHAAIQEHVDETGANVIFSGDNSERTVFVNAANWPQGSKAWLPSGKKVSFGMGAYGPVIVDLLDVV